MPTHLSPDSLLDHADFVRRLAWVLVRDDADADDVAQETLARAISRPPSDGERPRPWLSGVVRNVVSHMRRDRSRRDRRERSASRPERLSGPDESAARAETIRAVAAAVAALDEPYRSVVLLRHYDALPPREISARLGIPVGTVSTRLKRAHAQLRARLDSTEATRTGMSRAVLVAFVGGRAPKADASPVSRSSRVGSTMAFVGVAGRIGIAAAIALVAVAAYTTVSGPTNASGAGDLAFHPQLALDSGARPDAPPPPPPLASLIADPRSAHRSRSIAGASAAPTGVAAVAAIEGTCVDAGGKPLAGVEVYVLEKTLPGLRELRDPHATTDVEGRFRLATASIAGRWIGALKDGYLPSHVDGDETSAATNVRMVMALGGEIVASVEADDPEVLRSGSVDVTAIAPEGVSWEYPAPGRPWLTWSHAELGPGGRARVRIGTPGPVRVEANGNGINWVSEPAEVHLDHAAGEVSFRLVPSCVFRIRVVEAVRRRPFEGPIQWVRLDGASHAVVNGGCTTNPEGTGTVDDGLCLRTGTYRIRVMSDGYLPWTSEPLTLRRPGEAITVDATLARDPVHAGGTAFLSIPVAPSKGACWYRDRSSTPGRGAPDVLLRSKDGPWTMPGGTQLLESGHMLTTTVAWDDHARTLRIVGVPPGACDVLVWDRSSWTCGHATLSIPPNGIANATVRLVPGVRVRIGELTGPTARATRLKLGAADVSGLPAIDYISSGASRSFEDDDDPVPSDLVLAPLPFDEIRASFQPTTGDRKEVLVRAAPAR